MAEETTVVTETPIAETPVSSLGKADNPFDAPAKSSTFVTGSFFQPPAEEAKPELNEDGTVKAAEVVSTLDKVDAATATGATTESTTAEAATTEQVAEQIAESDFVGLLNEAIGDSNFSSISEIKAVLEENKKYKAAEGQLQELTQEERARIEIGREFNDFGLYDRVIKIDTTKISPKDALKQVYLIENLGENTQFLDKVFEKDFVKRFAEDEEDPDFSRMFLESEGAKAVQKIIDMQSDLKERGQISGGVDFEEAKKAKIESDNKWLADVDSVISKRDRVVHKTEGWPDLNIVMDGKDKTLFQKSMDEPIPFLKSLIMDDKGNFNHDLLFNFVMRNMPGYDEKARIEAFKAGAASREEKILKEKKNTVITTPAGDSQTKFNLNEELAKQIRSY